MPVIPNENVIRKVYVCNKYVIDVEPIPPSQRNNRNAQQGYLNHLKDTLDTLREIVEEAKSNRTSDNSLKYACVYTKTSQELLENMIASTPTAIGNPNYQTHLFRLCSNVVQASDLNVNKMASADNTSGLAPQRKERCTLQYALSLKEEKSSYLRVVLSTTSISSPARSVNNSGLMQNSVSPTPYVPPFKKDYEILFQQLFDEYFNPPPHAIFLFLAAVAAPRAVDLAGSPSSTTIDQDLPSGSTSPTTQEIQSQVTHQDIMADVNVNAPVKQAPVMAPPTRIDDQILPRSRSYSCQLDEKWFDLTKDTLRDALQITPVDNNHSFSSPPTPDILINFFNDLGYPKVIRTLSAIVTNDEKKKANPFVILSVRFTKLIIHHLQSKHKFYPRPNYPLYLPYEEYVLGYLKFSAKGTKRGVFGMSIPNELITDDIRGGQYYNEYLEKVAKHQRYLVDKEGSDPDSPAPKPARATKPKATKQSMPSVPKAAPITKPITAKTSKSTSSQQPKPTPSAPKHAPAKPQEKKRRLVKKTSDEPSPAKRSKPVSDTNYSNLDIIIQ
uniref:Histone deacetylase 14 n=1 Tax=Tanacetum cinerariifolium TaxID=118510 RepID=A0A699HSJ3_TANCI|nr:hypothetical protein [Tanacetum cinerariifolium]